MKKGFWAVVLGIIPVIWYFSLLDAYAVNVPKWDDHGLRAFLDRVLHATSVSGFFHAFWRQHNEHRIVFDRLLAFFDYAVTGKLNFVHLMWAGSLTLVGLLIIWWKAVRNTFSPALLLPLPYLLFTLSQWENMYWGMAAAQNFGVVFFSAWAIYFLTIRKKLVPALLAALLATCTSANGLIVWPILAVLWFLQAQPGKGIATAIAGGASWALYFWGYAKVPQPTHPVSSVIGSFLKASVLFLGSAFQPLYPSRPEALVWAGGIAVIVLALTAVVLILLRIRKKEALPLDFFLLGMLAYIAGTTVVVAAGRMGFDDIVFLTSRYKIYSVLLLMTLYTWVLRQGKWQVPVTLAGTGFGVLFLLTSYAYFLPEALRLRQQLLAMQYNWMIPGKPVVLSDAVNEPARAFYDSCDMQVQTAVVVPLMPIRYEKDFAVLPLAKGQPGNYPDCYYLAKGPKRSYLVPVNFNRTNRVFAHPGSPDYLVPVSETVVSYLEMDPGNYRLYFVDAGSGNGCRTFETGRSLEIPVRPRPAALPQNW